jgi:hypothetical protein
MYTGYVRSAGSVIPCKDYPRPIALLYYRAILGI